MQLQQLTISIDSRLASQIIQREMERILATPMVTSELVCNLAIPALGEYWPGEGGHNAGLVRGENGTPDYYLIVPPGKDAEFKAAWGGYDHETEGATSASDGMANTRALLADSEEHPAAKLASEFAADGHHDFYLPARRELQLAEANVPELFSKAYHWSSTQFSSRTAYFMDFEDGWQISGVKNGVRLVRPVRRKFI